ncbi:MAG TPA: hypothetical protein VLT33_37665 [Labilithrix sp.]|nr:hypothetical protein [Labilithrix sp.]
MKKLLVIAATSLAALVLIGSSSASADEELKPGGKGTCSALRLDGSVILVEAARPKGNSHDYVACGKALRERIKPLLCGAGKEPSQEYLYKISDAKPYKREMRCN